MDYVKKLFNLNPGKAEILDSVSEATGISKSQIINDALAIHYGVEDEMVTSRRQTVLLALRQLHKTDSGPNPPAAPPARKPPNKRPAKERQNQTRVK